MDGALMKKIREYESEKTRFSFISSVFGNIVTILFIFEGFWISIILDCVLGFPFMVSGGFFSSSCPMRMTSCPFLQPLPYLPYREQIWIQYHDVPPLDIDFIKSLFFPRWCFSCPLRRPLAYAMEPSFLVVLGMGLPVALQHFHDVPLSLCDRALFNKFTPMRMDR